MPRAADRIRFFVGLIGLGIVGLLGWLAIWVAIATPAFGWSSVAVMSGSMEPTIDVGDIVVVTPFDGEVLDDGSVIVFDNVATQNRTTHRIVDHTPTGDYVTRGDANDRLDSTPVAPDDVVGVGRMLIPYVGTPLVWTENGQWAYVALALLGLFAAVWMSRWALLPKFDPWKSRVIVPPTPGVRRPPWKRGAPIAAATVVALIAGVVTTTTRSHATFAITTANTGNSVVADILQPPTALNATVGASVSLGWTITPDTYALGHRVLRATASGGPYTQIGQTTPRTTATYVDSPADGIYYYVVRAYTTNWESVNSNQVIAYVGVSEDFDAIAPASDNCPTTFNPDQFDTDGDTIGDACDSSPTIASTGLFTSNGQALGSDATTGVALADFDADGDLDAVFANKAANKIFFNNGSATFADSGQSLGTVESHGVAVGDFDGDGDVDIAFANKAANTVWTNNGAGVFTNSGQSLGSTNSDGVAVGDFDGDGDLDIAYANATANTLYLNNGTGTFTDSGQTLEADESRALVVGDFDGDTDLDIAYANKTTSTIWVNDGSGTLTDSGQSLGTIGASVDAGDIDGDGDLDLAFGTVGVGANNVWVNNGTGTFTDSGQTPPGDARGTAFGDFNGDGDVDLSYALRTSNNTVLNNDGVGVFTDSGQLLDGGPSFGIAVGDLDGDGDLDHVIGNDGQPNTVWINGNIEDFDAVAQISDNCPVRFNPGQLDTDGDSVGDACDPSPTVTSSGVFTSNGQALGIDQSRDVELADFDGDGDLDALFANKAATGVWLNNGSGTLIDSGVVMNTLESFGMAVGDFDGDGDVDVTFANKDENTVWLNDGTGTFTDSGQLLGATTSNDAAVGDFDGDGDLDIAYANNAANSLWLNNGSGTFTDSGQVLETDESRSLVVGDFDGDLDLDIAYANKTNSNVWVNNGTGTLTDGGQAFVEGDSVDAGDIDGDGDLDLAFGVRGGGGNTVYVNNGTGTLTDSGQTLVGDVRDVALVDLDGDGDLDLAYALRTSGNTVLTNNGSGVFTDSGQLLDTGTSLGIGAGDLDGDGDLDLVIANDGEPNTVWINDAGPAVALADSWQSGLTHTSGAGSERVLMFVASNEQQTNSTPTLTGVTYGGQALTKVNFREVSNGCCTSRVEMWILDEAGIAAASNTTIVPTWTSSPNTPLYSHAVFANVDQLNPAGASSSAAVQGSTNPILPASVTTAVGDRVIGAATVSVLGTYTAQNGFTLGSTQQTSSGGTTALGTAHKSATGVNETVSLLFAPSATITAHAVVAIVLNGAS